MKFREAQKRPDNAFVNVNHRPSALGHISICHGWAEMTYSSSVSASTQAQSSTPVPPSLAPPHRLAPQLSASHLPRLNLKWSSRVFACSKIWPSDRGKYLKFCCSNDDQLVLLWKLNEANSDEGCSGLRRSCSW